MKDTRSIIAAIYITASLNLLVEGGSPEGVALGICLGLVAFVWMVTGSWRVR